MRHVLSAVVQNVPGVLAHISGMLASRGYNIDSLAVGETEERMEDFWQTLESEWDSLAQTSKEHEWLTEYEDSVSQLYKVCTL